MELNAWTSRLREVHGKAVEAYRKGNRILTTYFTPAEKEFLSSIGLKPINVFDAAEDFVIAGEPDWETFLLMCAVRRDYFLFEQHGKPGEMEKTVMELPGRQAQLGGIPWLPRIIEKARCFLEGGLCHDIMYCCGGDRHFLKTFNMHPADFLRVVWAAKGDDRKILKFVKSAGDHSHASEAA